MADQPATSESEAASVRLERLALKGVGPFEDAIFEIPEPVPGSRGELVLFEGPNGSGKSTLLEALAVLIGTNYPLSRAGIPPVNSPELIQILHRRGSDPSAGLIASSLLPPTSDCQRRFRHNAALFEARIRQKGCAFNTTFKHGDGYSTISPMTVDGFDTYCTELTLAANGAKTPLRWVAFAYRGHFASATLDTKGPSAIEAPPLWGALSFGRAPLGADYLGQVLVNLEFERVKALAYAAESGGDKKGAMLAAAEAGGKTLARFMRVLSKVLGREVTLEFPLGFHAPRLLFDGEGVPIDLLGEGLRRTVSWLADLLVRLELTPWHNPLVSPLDRPFWLLLDEVDESLHPTLQMCLLPALRELFPNARIYATTHSPFVVASAGEGYVFPIRPRKDHRVSGRVEPMKLEPGQSLEWVVEEVFGAPSTFLDQETVEALARHKGYVDALRRSEPVDWVAFQKVRAWLYGLNDEIRTVVAMREAPVRRTIDQQASAAPHETV
jgi:energy-coupling factor transporter ATP-binding protein EcfA2